MKARDIIIFFFTTFFYFTEKFHSKHINRDLNEMKDVTLLDSNNDNSSYAYVTTLTGHEGPVTEIIQSKTGLLLSISWDKSIKIWNPSDGNKLIHSYSCHDDAITSIVELKNGLIITASLDQTIKIWELKYEINNTILKNKELNFTLLNTIEAHDDGISKLREIQINSTNLIASASYDKTIKIWNMNTESNNITINKTLLGHKWVVSDIIQLKNGMLVSASWDKNISFWNNTNDFNLENTFVAHSDAINSVKELQSGNLATAGADKLINIWDLKNLTNPNFILEGHKGSVNSLKELSFGLIASVSDDKSIIIWDLNNLNLNHIVEKIVGHNDGILSIMRLAGEANFATTSKDNHIKLWNKSKNTDHTLIIILIITGSVAFISLIVCILICKKRNKTSSSVITDFVKYENI